MDYNPTFSPTAHTPQFSVSPIPGSTIPASATPFHNFCVSNLSPLNFAARTPLFGQPPLSLPSPTDPWSNNGQIASPFIDERIAAPLMRPPNQRCIQKIDFNNLPITTYTSSLKLSVNLTKIQTVEQVQQSAPTVRSRTKRPREEVEAPRISCNCTRTKCLKLYCDCFAVGEYCINCNCVGCMNTPDTEQTRANARKVILERNPNAFQKKINVDANEHLVHEKGCQCKNSACLKKYCECFKSGARCTGLCKCVGCKNIADAPVKRRG